MRLGQSNSLANEKAANRSLIGQTRYNHHDLVQLYSTTVPSNISDSQMIPFSAFKQRINQIGGNQQPIRKWGLENGPG